MLTTLMAGPRPAPPVAKVVDPEAATVPYPMRGKGPFNAPQPCNIIVDSGTPESCVHPSVWDFGPGKKWNGYLKNLCKDGSHYWVYATVVPNIRNGKVEGYASIRREPSRAKIEAIIAEYKPQLEAERGNA